MERSDRVRLGESPNQLVTIERTTNRPNVRTHNESCERRNVAQSVRIRLQRKDRHAIM